MSTQQYLTRDCDCTAPRGDGYARPVRCEKHGDRFQTAAELAPPKERTPMRRVSEKRQAEIDAGERPRQTSTLKPGRGFSVAPVQRAKVKLLTCLGCGREVDPDTVGEWTIDPAHLVPRSAGGCDDERCVIPLCRHLYIPGEGCHPAYDRNELDLHPRLAMGGYEKEIAHAIEVHGFTLLELVRQVTGEVYIPRRELEVATARIVELESAIHA